jgi:hypothetical protein
MPDVAAAFPHQLRDSARLRTDRSIQPLPSNRQCGGRGAKHSAFSYGIVIMGMVVWKPGWYGSGSR